MKKIMLLITLLFISCSNVLGQEQKEAICEYSDANGDVYEVVLGEDAYFKYLPDTDILVSNYEQNSVPSIYCSGTVNYDPFSGSTARQYMDQGNGCPEYLHLMYESTQGVYVAFFSKEDKTKTGCNYIQQEFKKKEYKLEVDNNSGQLVVEDNVTINKYFGEIRKVEKSFDLVINETQKTVSISSTKFSLFYVTYDEIVSSDKLLICEESDGSNYIYSSLEKVCAEENVSESYCNLKYYDNCAYVYPEESDKILMHDGCPMFFSYYSSQNIEGIKKYCSAVLKINNYSSNENSCINLCLNKIKDLYQNQYPSTRCGMSGRLILFIGKVVKWMKYLVPVIVIVLSIIDFIKATGADKEDEIKKAQNKFIRRLIIAALIFIMPFIIEFVLNKMGFDASGCGIIDL